MDFDKARDELRISLQQFMSRYPSINVLAVGVGWVPSQSGKPDPKEFNGLIIPRDNAPLTIQQCMQVFAASQALTKHSGTMIAQSAHSLAIEKKMLEGQVKSLAERLNLGEPPNIEDIQLEANSLAK